MEEANLLATDSISHGYKALDGLKRQDEELHSSRNELVIADANLNQGFDRLLEKSSWVAWVWNGTKSGHQHQQVAISSPNGKCEQEGTGCSNSDWKELPAAAEGKEEGEGGDTATLCLLEKVDTIQTLSHALRDRIQSSNQRIDAVSTSSEAVEEDLLRLRVKIETSVATLSQKLEAKGVYRLKFADSSGTGAGNKYLLSKGGLLCTGSGAGVDDGLEFVWYCSTSPSSPCPIGGLLHVSSGRWLGIDLWGRPVVQSRKWDAWEAIAFSPNAAAAAAAAGAGVEPRKGIRLLFLARYWGRGGYLARIADPHNFSASFQVSNEGDRVEIELEALTPE
jgi:hypothetical protein